jgi:CubicO group peptidase (beta-lactamase class C family)
MKALDQVRGWPANTVSAGYLDASGESHVIGPSTSALPLASVTKPMFAYAVLIAVEEGTLALDQPAGPPGSTVAHLLAHASGLGHDPAAPLAPVGQRRIYSNAGFEVLGQTLAAASGMSAAEYFHLAVVDPLGLDATTLSGSPAHDAASSVANLLTLCGEWLSPTLVSPPAMARAVEPWWPDLAGVLPGFGRQEPNRWGLGFEIKGTKAPHWTGAANSPATFGHFGRSGTFVWVDPVARMACVALTDEPFGPWALTAWPALSDAVLAEG